MNLSPHFTLDEFINSPTAKAKGISNSPTAEHLKNMIELAQAILEPVREHFGKPIKINSGYRSPELNKAIGGASSSQHCNGQAVDFEIEGIPNRDVAEWLTKNLIFDQCILEFWIAKEANSGWVHASYKKGGINRKQKLVAQKNGVKTVYQVVTTFPAS